VSCNIGTERCFGGLYIEDTGVLALRNSEDDIGVVGISDGDGVRNVGCCGIMFILLQRLGDSFINIFFHGRDRGRKYELQISLYHQSFNQYKII